MPQRQSKPNQAAPTVTLELLQRIDDDSHITQRSLARELGIALGLANTYLKRCVKKGLIKIYQAPANRYVYYLTPKGFAEKSRLTSEYFSQSFQFFRMARADIAAVLKYCVANRYKRLVMHGLTDLAEIALLCANDADISIVAIVDKDTSKTSYAEIPILRTVEEKACDVILITDLGDPQMAYNRLLTAYPELPIVAPSFLKINTSNLRKTHGEVAKGTSS